MESGSSYTAWGKEGGFVAGVWEVEELVTPATINTSMLRNVSQCLGLGGILWLKTRTM